MDNKVNEPRVTVEEVSGVIEAAPGTTIYEALRDAALSGFKSIVVEGSKATVTWLKRS